MARKYFPGAIGGSGFENRFSGIVPPWDKPHYTYILKGGPGVGKSTLMKKVAEKAEMAGLAVEEFFCASDPGSLDAIRIPEMRIVLADGTSPHAFDPDMPGISAEILDLGRFINKDKFAESRFGLTELAEENAFSYRKAYSCLAAARELKKSAMEAAEKAADMAGIHSYALKFLRDLPYADAPRVLFTRAATPRGVVDFGGGDYAAHTVSVPGLCGMLLMREVARGLQNKCAEIYPDFVFTDIPREIYFPGAKVAVCNPPQGGDDTDGCWKQNAPDYAEFCLAQADALVARAVGELGKCLETHDKIESIYHQYVDYEFVERSGAGLLRILGL